MKTFIKPAAVVLAWISGFAGSGLALAAETQKGVTSEAVDDYGSCNCSLSNAKANVDGFLSKIVPSGATAFSRGGYYRDALVYDTDFYDSQATGSSYDSDSLYFDVLGGNPTAISYFSGHGFCDDYDISRFAPPKPAPIHATHLLQECHCQGHVCPPILEQVRVYAATTSQGAHQSTTTLPPTNMVELPLTPVVE